MESEKVTCLVWDSNPKRADSSQTLFPLSYRGFRRACEYKPLHFERPNFWTNTTALARIKFHKTKYMAPSILGRPVEVVTIEF